MSDSRRRFHSGTEKAGGNRLRPFLLTFSLILALDEALLDHLLIAEPQIGDVG
jgi:hypothetical protein